MWRKVRFPTGPAYQALPDARLTFGGGMHYCLGSQVARREVRTLLAKVLERVDTIEMAGTPEWSAAHFVSGIKRLPIRYTLA